MFSPPPPPEFMESLFSADAPGPAAEQQQQQQQQQEQHQQQQQQQAAECTAAAECCGEAAGALQEEPATPQRQSKGDSCWSESPLSGSLDQYAEVQSPGEQQFGGGAKGCLDCCIWVPSSGWPRLWVLFGRASGLSCWLPCMPRQRQTGRAVAASSCVRTFLAWLADKRQAISRLPASLCHMTPPLQPLGSSWPCPAPPACLPPSRRARLSAPACRRWRWPFTTRSACDLARSRPPPAPGVAVAGAHPACRCG